MVNAAKAEELGFVNSDMVIMKGKKRHQSPAVLFIDENQNADNASGEKVYMNKVMRKNLKVKLGDMVTLTKIDDLPNCEQIHVLPFSDSIEGVTGNLFDG
jgi:transitional endoplasmic reticulum ATPase